MTLLFGAKDVLADIDLIVDLEGTWRFRTGDHITWRHPGYNHEHWDTITVPATWESQGYDHDGYAWYRKTFTLPEEYKEMRLFVVAGKIDDADQTFLNGQRIGAMGVFPPDSQTEWNTLRVYEIPGDLLEEENVLAIRVYDMGQEGGIHEGPVGIIRDVDRDALFNIRREPHHSFHYMTTSNGYGAAVVNTQTGLIEHFYESIYKMQDPQTETRDLLAETGARYVIDGEEFNLRTMQPVSAYYGEQTGIITLNYENGLLLDIFAPFQVELPSLIIAARADIGYSLESFTLDYRITGDAEDVHVSTYRDDALNEWRTILYRSDEPRDIVEAFLRDGDIVASEVNEWKALHERAYIPNGMTDRESALYRQSLSILKMGQSRESGRPNGQIVASLPPGMWNITWVRDGMYAIAAFIRAGLLDEARKGLRFYLNADAGYYEEYIHTDGRDYGIGMPYQISVCRYFGDGTEESDSNEDGPNIELDGFGMFLWALEKYIAASDDTDFLTEYWDVVTAKIADVIVASKDNTGLIRADSGPWERHLPGQRFAFTSIFNWRGLNAAGDLAERLGDTGHTVRYREAADSLRNSILRHLVDEDNVIKSNYETRNPAERGYYDASVVEAINLGLIEPDGGIAEATMERLRNVLRMEHRPLGYRRINNGDWYDRQEWIIINLRMITALSKMERHADAEELLDWVVGQSELNYNLIAELYDEYTAGYEGAVPMVGFGAGAYILALQDMRR